MKQLSIWKTFFVLTGACLAGFGFSAPSQAIPHDGETRLCGNCGGVSFSWFHRANSNPTSGGGFSKQIQDRTQVRYEWLPDGPVSGTSRQIFNRGSSRILESSINGIDFTVDLWTDHAGNRTGSDAGDLNVLFVRDDTVVNGGTHLGFDLTHRVSGRFGFTITTADAVIFDEFIFDEAFDMGSVDKIGNATDGSGDVGTFLWGYTAGHAGQDSTTVCLEGTSQSCNTFIDALYGVNGVGIDLLYTGSFSPVAEPGASGLLAIGVAGLAVTRRRRNT